jgi:hypothetical protein
MPRGREKPAVLKRFLKKTTLAKTKAAKPGEVAAKKTSVEASEEGGGPAVDVAVTFPVGGSTARQIPA